MLEGLLLGVERGDLIGLGLELGVEIREIQSGEGSIGRRMQGDKGLQKGWFGTGVRVGNYLGVSSAGGKLRRVVSLCAGI